MQVPAPDDRADPPPASATGVSAPPQAGARVRRPPAVTILAVVQLLSAAAYGLVLAILLVGGPAVLEALTSGGSGETPALDLELAALVVIVGGLCIAALVAGILLLRMRQLGWTITMLLAGLSLGASIYVWWADGTALSIWLLVQVVTVFYLNQRQVREAFGISRREAGGALDQGRP